jgi:hypothetical protein
MPLPKPEKNEREAEFIRRCMENKITKEEFPDSSQRLAVCYSQWRKKDDK